MPWCYSAHFPPNAQETGDPKCNLDVGSSRSTLGNGSIDNRTIHINPAVQAKERMNLSKQLYYANLTLLPDCWSVIGAKKQVFVYYAQELICVLRHKWSNWEGNILLGMEHSAQRKGFWSVMVGLHVQCGNILTEKWLSGVTLNKQCSLNRLFLKNWSFPTEWNPAQAPRALHHFAHLRTISKIHRFSPGSWVTGRAAHQLQSQARSTVTGTRYPLALHTDLGFWTQAEENIAQAGRRVCYKNRKVLFICLYRWRLERYLEEEAGFDAALLQVFVSVSYCTVVGRPGNSRPAGWEGWKH